MALLEFTPQGLWCPQADVYIDPQKPVKRALLTHGHSDHARWGSKHYLCAHQSKPIIQYRLGNTAHIEGIAYGETRSINGVKFSFHPAGHIVGSAQIRVEYDNEVWVVSGDYKTENDGICTPFEPVRCNVFITESTFGLPVFRWQPQREVMREINDWWRANKDEGKISVMAAYALGKAQRVLKGLDAETGPIFTHGSITSVNMVLRGQGLELPEGRKVTTGNVRQAGPGSFVIAPPTVLRTVWVRRFKNVSVALASGWMAIEGTAAKRGVDRGFALSDHADWPGLNEAVMATGAEKVFVTHGYTEEFAQSLREKGIDAVAVP